MDSNESAALPGVSPSSPSAKNEEEKEIKYAQTPTPSAAATSPLGNRRLLPAAFVDQPRGAWRSSLHISSSSSPSSLPPPSSSLYTQPLTATLPATFAAASVFNKSSISCSSTSSGVRFPSVLPPAAGVPTRLSVQPPSTGFPPRLVKEEEYNFKSSAFAAGSPTYPLPVLLCSPLRPTGRKEVLTSPAAAAATATAPAAAGGAPRVQIVEIEAKPHQYQQHQHQQQQQQQQQQQLPGYPFQVYAAPSSYPRPLPLTYPAYSPSPPGVSTVARFRLPPSNAPTAFVLPMKEMETCTKLQSRHASPFLTTYVLDGARPPHRRRNVAAGRRRSLCEEFVLPCLDTLIGALSRVCNCSNDLDFSSSKNLPQAMLHQQLPPTGDSVCLRCGAFVDSRAITSGWTGAAAAAAGAGVGTGAYQQQQQQSFGGGMLSSFFSSSQTQQQNQRNKEGRIPLPTFSYSSAVSPRGVNQSDTKKKGEKKKEDAATRAARLGRLRSSALGFPTDDEGLVALPAFSLNGAR